MKPILILTLGLLAGPALAQPSAEDARANAVVLPMVQESTQQMPGASAYVAQLLTACIVAVARPEEKAALASAPGPSQELADQIVTPILARPELRACIEASRQ